MLYLYHALRSHHVVQLGTTGNARGFLCPIAPQLNVEWPTLPPLVVKGGTPRVFRLGSRSAQDARFHGQQASQACANDVRLVFPGRSFQSV